MDPAEHRAISRRIARRFRRHWHRAYADRKLRYDPAYRAAASLVIDSGESLLDIGCGLGLLGFYLRERGFRGAYRGVDFDAHKIAEAQHVARSDAGLAFDGGSATSLPTFSGHVALLDVLHYLSAASQQELLRDAAARVAPGAVLIIRNVLRERNWRFHATVIEEHVLYATRWMRSPALHYPARDEILTPLREAGLVVEVSPLWGFTPFNSFVIVARRPPATTVMPELTPP
ncbi:MAG: class I SAM-dependent methyltransferase [Dokdonella sp.]